MEKINKYRRRNIPSKIICIKRFYVQQGRTMQKMHPSQYILDSGTRMNVPLARFRLKKGAWRLYAFFAVRVSVFCFCLWCFGK